MMTLAGRVGIAVPATRLVHRDELEDIPDVLWPAGESFALAVERFDPKPGDERVHIEDFAEVRGFYPGEDKYRGTYETLASLIHRRHDRPSVLELVRRLAFIVLIRNGDAHLKNFSLIYPDRRIPKLAPAYELVATSHYYDGAGRPDTLALRLGGDRRFETVSAGTFATLQRKLEVPDASFVDEVAQTVERVLAHWPDVRERLEHAPLAATIDRAISEGIRRLRRARE